MRTYINGTLYSILVKASLKARAEEIGLPEQLRLQMGHSDETFARQINYILEQIEKEPQPEDDEPQSEEEGAEEEEEEEEGGEEEGAEEDDEVDVFPEAAMELGAAGVEGEQLLVQIYMQTDVNEAEHDAQQLEASMRMEDDRRAAASSQKPNEPFARKRHNPDEPLQRPTTPRATDGKEGEQEEEKVDYGELAMKQSGALKEEDGDGGDGGEALEAGEGGEGEGANAASYTYPDPDSVDPNSPTISVRNRLARTPSRTTRGAPLPGQPLQPTAPRARANVAPLQRSRKEEAAGGGGSPNPPGGSRKGGTKGAGAFDGAADDAA